MLDFTKLYKQIQEVGVDAVREASYQDIVEKAFESLELATAKPESFENRLEANSGWVLWPVAVPLESFGQQKRLPVNPEKVTVVGVDGSQIMPSHHEVHNCYLLNVGLAAISYGEKHASILESSPVLYHRPEDLYPLVDRRRMHIDELFVSLERTVLELETAASAAIEMQERALPVVALCDGTLIPWSVEKMPPGYQRRFLGRIESAMELMRTAGIPLVGYISHSRSSDMVNMLRTFICPYDLSNCREHCGHLNEEDFPCSIIWPLTDRQLLGDVLGSGKRSSVCLTGASVSRTLASEHQICFCYINLGSEIARIEFPRSLFENEELFALALGAIESQVEKGKGYPIALSEAHHQAVIRGRDREQFFDQIARHLVSLGVNRVKTSPKESKKRVGFV